VYFGLKSTIFYFIFTPTSKNVHTITVLLGPENVGLSCGKLLLSAIEAEILRYFISTSSFWRPSSICDSRLYGVHVSPVAFLDCKCSGLVMRFPLVYFVQKLRPTFLKPTSGI
jgi:hypothetical protein